MHPRCIKCNGEHATRECSINEKIAEPVCVNCGEKDHLAAWKGCKAFPVIKKTTTRQPGKSTLKQQQLRKDRRNKQTKRPFRRKRKSHGSDRSKRLDTDLDRSENATARISNTARSASTLQRSSKEARKIAHNA
ncbi:hypothetical protein AVEN_205843-1 [Araneus ventricosus]|uniref:Nucleic-acid-binding protein from transposon X-element n=1 Tax=Araneus ventricosus TaxID=182803 RepID=A0A4Y1ZMN6_ARAVE|nr:hypothetical protein AVEN_137135-1 [Araneus ventricosus]GBL57594.1 hypothetical protein AVEN_205843-1 [Araneus ventricosus]